MVAPKPAESPLGLAHPCEVAAAGSVIPAVAGG